MRQKSHRYPNGFQSGLSTHEASFTGQLFFEKFRGINCDVHVFSGLQKGTRELSTWKNDHTSNRNSNRHERNKINSQFILVTYIGKWDRDMCYHRFWSIFRTALDRNHIGRKFNRRVINNIRYAVDVIPITNNLKD